MRMDPLCTGDSCSACAEILVPPKRKHMLILTEVFSLQPGSSSKAPAPTKHRKAKTCISAKRQVSNDTHPVRASLHLQRLYPVSSFLPLLV